MGRVLTVSYGASTCASDGTRNIDARNGLVWPQSVLFAIRHVTPVNLAPVTPLPASPASVIPTPCLARATGDAISMRNVALASPSAALVALVGVQMRRYPIRPAIPGVQPADARQARISRQDMDHPIALRSCGHGWNCFPVASTLRMRHCEHGPFYRKISCGAVVRTTCRSTIHAVTL